MHLLVQKATKYTEDCCVNSIIFAFVFFVGLLNLGKPKKSIRTQKRGNKYSITERHINACCVHEFMTCVL